MVLRIVEQQLRRPVLDDPAGGVLLGEKERALLAHPLRLLHVVGDDDDGQ